VRQLIEQIQLTNSTRLQASGALVALLGGLGPAAGAASVVRPACHLNALEYSQITMKRCGSWGPGSA